MVNTKLIKIAAVWGIYLTATMILFENLGITPESVGGVVGWFFVETVRAGVGLFLVPKITK